MAKKRCEEEGIVLTDAGDQIAVRCSYTWDPKNSSIAGGRVPLISPPAHEHYAELIFKNSQPFTLKWGN